MVGQQTNDRVGAHSVAVAAIKSRPQARAVTATEASSRRRGQGLSRRMTR
jgi:hypothetical protein